MKSLLIGVIVIVFAGTGCKGTRIVAGDNSLNNSQPSATTSGTTTIGTEPAQAQETVIYEEASSKKVAEPEKKDIKGYHLQYNVEEATANPQ